MNNFNRNGGWLGKKQSAEHAAKSAENARKRGLSKTRTCITCGVTKTVHEWNKTRPKSAKYCSEQCKKRQCKFCGKIFMFAGTKRSKYCSEVCAENKSLSVRLAVYELPFEQYIVLLKSQNNRCAICGLEEADDTSGRRLAVDHCHKTGRVRGLLCSRCNTGLGYFKDNIQSLTEAVKYLQVAEDWEVVE